MADNTKYIPVSLTASFNGTEVNPAPSPLTSPYNLTVLYDPTPVGDAQTLQGIGFDSSGYGFNLLTYNQDVFAGNLYSFQSGATLVFNSSQLVYPSGFSSSTTGVPASVVNRNRYVVVKPSPVQTLYGRPLVYNLLQFVRPTMYDAARYGSAYLQGGVKYLDHKGANTSAYGKPLVINTTANQEVKTTGIAPPLLFGPVLSPRSLFPKAFYRPTIFGNADIRIPVFFPKGIEPATKYGINTTVWFHTRPLYLDGINSFESGYPKIFDPTQFVQEVSVIQSAVFGDMRIINKSVTVTVSSINDSVVEQWAIVENNRRYYSISGIESQSFGDTSIQNGTPSVFVQGIAPPDSNPPAIGYYIQEIKPAAFNNMVFGRPVLTKTPELFPKPFASSVVQKPTVWFKNRTIALANKGFDSNEYGTAIAWFRYRHVRPTPWVSSKYANPTATHGVRELLGRGFIRDAYGNAWISHGQRTLEPASIHQDYPSRHMVGGTRHLEPVGYVATLFGTRIIPEQQLITTQGFTGAFGLTAIDLYTKYLKPLGYNSYGNQPANRWGAGKVFNSLQYITQTFDGNSGLVPPPWSTWTVIDNRNKQLNTSGHLSSKFGYSNIYNNAAPLLPTPIEPPLFNKPMISEANRPIPLDGIEPPPMSDWTVIYNDAKVLAPTGFNAELFGMADALKTRRYYSNIGMIDSFNAGVPMIAYAIRTIDIETRYSIAPPYINLPTIDTLTKYATFRGYETAAYGRPSLSIHFNIIHTRWAHKDNPGYPLVKNVTPEVGAYGHNSELFGGTAIRTEWRNVYANGEIATLIGLAKIADKKQFVKVFGWRDTVVAQKHKVVKTGAPPYSTQQISLDGWYDFDKEEYRDGDGIAFDEAKQGKRVPNPFLNQNVLKARGYDAAEYGKARLWSNNIKVQGDIAMHNIGADIHVGNANRTISLQDKGIDAVIEVGKPRMSPWTIYAVVEAPAQAKKNHQYQALHYVGESRDIPAGEKFGRVKVESTIRSVFVRSHASSKFGAQQIELFKRYLSPFGMTRTRVGLPSIPFTPQYIDAQDRRGNVNDMSRYGKPDVTVMDYGDKEVKGIGISSLRIGLAAIDLKTRYLLANGFNSQAMGSKRANDKPYMWQGLRVGEHVPNIISGGETLEFGLAFISPFIRDIQIDGFNAFASEYDTDGFGKRMTVRNADKQLPANSTITVDGIYPVSTIGYQDIKLGQHYIRPDGNSDQFRKGAF